MERNDLRSQSLDLLRFPLALVVLIIHVFNTRGFALRGSQVSVEDMPVLLEINHFIDGFLRGQSVPIYFFISGFVFFLGVEMTRGVYARKLRNRVHTLLIPYIVWNIIDVLIVLARHLPMFSSVFPNIHNMPLDFSLSAILETFWDSSKGIFALQAADDGAPLFPQDKPLWFLRDLMIVVLCTPLICWMLKRMRHYFVWVLGILWFVLEYWSLGHVNQLLSAFFFFSWGAYMSVCGKDMIKEFNRYFKPSMVLYPLLAVLFVCSVHWFPWASDTIKRMNVFVGLLFAYNLASWLVVRGVCRPNPLLTSASFFVYVSHALICDDLPKLLFFVFRPETQGGMILVYLSATIIIVGMILLAYCGLKRYAPSLLRLMTGRK